VFWACLLLPLPAAGQEVLEWRAPRDCPSPDEARAGIVRLLQRELPQSFAASFEVEIVREQPDLLRARISLRDAAGSHEQVLRDPSCAALTHAAAVTVALAFEPMLEAQTQPEAGRPARLRLAARSPDDTNVEPTSRAAASEPEPTLALSQEEVPPLQLSAAASQDDQADAHEPQPTAPAPSEPTQPPSLPAASTAADSPPERTETTLYLGLGAGLTSGVLPKLAPSATLVALLSRDQLRCALRLGFAPAQLGTLQDPSGVGGRVALATIGGDVGVAVALGSHLELPLTVGAETGFLAATGYGVPQHSTRLAAWLAGYLGTGLAYTWSEGRWRAAFHIAGLIALRRPRFGLEAMAAADPVFHRPDLLGARGILMLQLRLP
jgi:hypothetical protein